jgi:hypothetical protein
MSRYGKISLVKRAPSVILAIALLLGTLVDIASGSNPKTGTPCIKLNQVAIVNGFTYTCMKSGKKLVWSKGVKVPAPIPSQSASPTSFPAPTPTPTLSPTPAVTPTPTPSPVFTPPEIPTSFKDLSSHLSGIIYGAWLKASQAVLNNKPNLGTIHLIIGPNTKLNADDANYLESIQAVSSLYSGFAQVPNLNLVYFGLQDVGWAQEQFNKIEDTHTWDGPTSATDTCPSIDCNGGNTYHTANYDGLIMAGNNNGRQRSIFPADGAFFAHEYTHTIQFFNMKNGYSPGPWFREGGANFSSAVASYSSDYQKYLKFRYSTTMDQYKSPNDFNAEWMTKFLNPNMETGPNQDIDAYWNSYPRFYPYSVGYLTVEVLACLKGPEGLMKVYQDLGNGKTFEQAFESEYGMSWRDAVPYIARAIADELSTSTK